VSISADISASLITTGSVANLRDQEHEYAYLLMTTVSGELAGTANLSLSSNTAAPSAPGRTRQLMCRKPMRIHAVVCKAHPCQ